MVPTQLPAFPDKSKFPCRVSPVTQPLILGEGIVIVPVNGGLSYPKNSFYRTNCSSTKTNLTQVSHSS